MYSRVTTSVAAVAFFLSPFTLHEEGSEGSARGREMAHTTGDSTTSGVWRRTGPQRRLAAASHGEETSTPSSQFFPHRSKLSRQKSSLPCVSRFTVNKKAQGSVKSRAFGGRARPNWRLTDEQVVAVTLRVKVASSWSPA